jgi:hypothetical protein
MPFITGLIQHLSLDKGIDQRFGTRQTGRQLIVRVALTLECRAAWKFEGSYRMWISKISSDLSGGMGETLEL